MVKPKKPPGITTEDWEQLPPSVRAFVTQSVEHIAQLEAGHSKQERKVTKRMAAQSTSLSPETISRGGNLLVVDDNAMNRDMLSRRLNRQGYTVEMAVNGLEALDLIKERRFDLVLLDIMMPVMNGYQVLEHLKADPELRHLPVIMVSAVDDLESVIRCVQLGAEDYLFKPFNPVLLKARLEASLEKKWLRDQQKASMLRLDIENRRQADELERARQIQLSMLPTAPPLLPYLDIAAQQETASEVGGDYYDFFPRTNGKLRVAVGDATGHGVASGLMVSMTKASLLATHEAEFSTLMPKINSILNRIDLGTQLNMALLLLEFSYEKDKGIAVRAFGGGIPPLYILRATGDLEEVFISAFPLGIIEDALYTQTEFYLNSGDVLLMMSDGLSEMFSPERKLLGYNRLITALDQIETALLTAAEILEQVAHIGTAWADGQPLNDDVTLVVLKVT